MCVQIEPLVSVVTPFYNTEEYLAECIESVLNQTYQNWEYVLVNNCSTDSSAEIAKKYSYIDKRIRLINNEKFLTQVKNYNHALHQICSESKYCKMVQANDWIFPECLSMMVAVVEKDASIGIVGAYSLKGSKVINDGLPYLKQPLMGRDVGRTSLLLDGRQIFGSPTTTLVRSEVLRNRDPFFCEGCSFEDTDACFAVLRSWNFGFVYQVLSFIRVENESVSSCISSFDPEWFLAKFIRIVKHGNYFLDAAEYQQRFQAVKYYYFRYLAHNVFCGREEDFWKYHRDGLATVGYELNFSSLAKYIGLEILDILFNPKATVGRVLRTFRGSK